MRLSDSSTLGATLAMAAVALERLHPGPDTQEARGPAAREARLLLAAALDRTPSALAASLLAERDAPIGAAAAALLGPWLERRLSGVPVARILGVWEFWSLLFRLSDDTLVPRPDTETLVVAGLAALAGLDHPRILDLGTGSGCILIALLHDLEDATGVGVDISLAALAVAKRNALELGIGARAQFVASDWAAGLRPPGAGFDLIVSNPPYIATATISTLEPEVREHDPARALDGGIDGLEAYRRLLPSLTELLKPGAGAVLEVGAGQAHDVAHLGVLCGLRFVGTQRDLAGHERAVLFQRPFR